LQTETLVTNRKLIFKHYMSGWFTVDFVSTVPMDLLADLADGSAGYFSSVKVNAP
jgi:hypothetical protein